MSMINTQELLNPYLLEKATDLQLSDKINELSSKYRYSEEYKDIAFNINLESELLIIYGEFIARLTKKVQKAKYELENKITQEAYNLKNEHYNTERFKRNIDYFKSMASDKFKIEYEKLKEDEAMLIRFKRCYESVEVKQNALKKNLEAIKFDSQ